MSTYRPGIGATLHTLRSLASADHFESIVPTHAGLAYGPSRRRGVAPLVDVYLPAGDAPHPSVLLVHGGGFLIGSRGKKPIRLLASHLVIAGYAACAVDYRMVFRGGRLSEAVEDVLAAMTWWHQQAPRYGLDTACVSILGLSAGGALTVLASGHTAAPPIHRIVSVFGLYDFRSVGGLLASRIPRLLLRTADREQWRRESPAYAPQSPAPTLLLHGTEDGLVPVEQAQRLAARRRSEGLPTELVVYEGAPHAFLNFPGPVADQALAQITAFLAAEGELKRSA